MTAASAGDGASRRDAVDELVQTMAILRSECPWDRVQTHASLRRHLLEETHEVLEVLDRIAAESVAASDGQSELLVDDLREELGDLLFQVVFHAHLAAENGWFDLVDVAAAVNDKLVARHPAIFPDGPGPATRSDSGTVSTTEVGWEQAKVAEKGRSSVMDGIPRTLPALAYAAKVVGKAGAVGVDPVIRSADEEHDPEQALGLRLLDVVREARAAGLDAEAALRRAAMTLETDVRAVEATRQG